MPHKPSWRISAALAVGFSILYFGTLAQVPFHPDESSWIVMSRDFDDLFLRRDLAAFAWEPGQASNPTVEYQLLNAPVPKYFIGLGWWLAGYTPTDLNSDWHWGMTWDENVRAGRLPSPGVLWASRAPGALLTGLSIVLMFWIGCAVRGVGVGLVAALLHGFNALNLLHGRRAMAEGAALFFSLLAVWACLTLFASSVSGWKRLGLAGLVGIILGFAIASKQTNGALLLLGVVVVFKSQWRTTISAGLVLLVSSALTFWALNPILYRYPLEGVRAMITARADLVQRQLHITPELALFTPVARLRSAVLHVYLWPLAYADVANYDAALQPQILAYATLPFQTLTRSRAAGAFLLGGTLIGLIYSALRLWRTRTFNAEAVIWMWGAASLGLILLAIPLTWQRYFLPLVPLASLFSAFGLADLVQPFRRFYEVRNHHQPQNLPHRN